MTSEDIFSLVPADLLAELYDSGSLDQSLLDFFIREGVSIEALTRPYMVAADTVTFNPDGTYDRGPDGRLTAVIIPVLGIRGRVIDLCAWRHGSGRLGTWLGHAFALGEGQIHQAATYAFDRGLVVHRTPLGWLRAGRRGIVIIDEPRAYERLAHVPRLEPEDARHAAEIRRLLTPPKPSVTILPRTASRRAA
jgi:hypothetical protein